jgi:hypothetical protein
VPQYADRGLCYIWSSDFQRTILSTGLSKEKVARASGPWQTRIHEKLWQHLLLQLLEAMVAYAKYCRVLFMSLNTIGCWSFPIYRKTLQPPVPKNESLCRCIGLDLGGLHLRDMEAIAGNRAAEVVGLAPDLNLQQKNQRNGYTGSGTLQ